MTGMGCIQNTMRPVRAFSALTWDGLAPDAAFTGLPPVLGRRLHIAAGERRACCGAALSLVAIEPGDPALPAQISLADLASGQAVADKDLGELVGGWVAMPGVSVRITGSADLGAALVAITLADAAALLSADGGQRIPVTTTVIVDGRVTKMPAGWRTVADGATSVPLRTEAVDQHRCAA